MTAFICVHIIDLKYLLKSAKILILVRSCQNIPFQQNNVNTAARFWSIPFLKFLSHLQRLDLVTGLSTPSASRKKAHEELCEAKHSAFPTSKRWKRSSRRRERVVSEATQVQGLFRGCIAALSWLSIIYVIWKYIYVC